MTVSVARAASARGFVSVAQHEGYSHGDRNDGVGGGGMMSGTIFEVFQETGTAGERGGNVGGKAAF
jgi:hypothetical protein